jgi:hypothetical protein
MREVQRKRAEWYGVYPDQVDLDELGKLPFAGAASTAGRTV